MEFSQSQDMLDQARASTAGTRDALYQLKQKLAKVRRQQEQLAGGFDPKNESPRQRKEALATQEEILNVALTEKTGKLKIDAAAELAQLKEFLTFTDARIHLPQLNDNYPILLLPLRLETRFKEVTVPGSTTPHQQLWIRVFPDEIAIDTFEPILSEDELRNAKSYWLAMWKAADVETEQRGAWRSLVASHGSGRAYWITQNYLPLNQSEQPTHKDKDRLILAIGKEVPLPPREIPIVQKFWEAFWRAAEDGKKQAQAQQELIDAIGTTHAKEIQEQYLPFNLSDLPPVGTDYKTAKVTVVLVTFPNSTTLNTKLQSWSVPPMVNVLPERLVVQGFYQDKLDINVIGEPIASPLIVGPDPSAKEGEDIHLEGDDLVVSNEMKWLVDFDEAVIKGMGFKIDLSAEQALRGFDRLFVLGVRMSAGVDRGQELLENLFEHHHYSRKGLSILRQGTPTNNTDKAAAGYHWQEDSDVSFKHYFAAEDGAAAASTMRTDGQWLAEGLGINAAKFSAIENFTATDHTDAKSMNIALWPATLGYFMQSMMTPVFSDEVITQTREFFTQFVSCRGVLPAIRIGNQPYGILPATTFSRMNWLRPVGIGKPDISAASANMDGSAFLFRIYSLLKVVDKEWGKFSSRVSQVGKRDDQHQLLLDIIALHPNSVEIYSRYAQSLEHLHNYYNLIGFPMGLQFGDTRNFSADKYFASGMKLLAGFGYPTDAETVTGIPEILSKFFFENGERLTGRLIDDGVLSETEALRVHTTNKKNYIDWLIDAARTSHDALRRQEGFINDNPPTALLYLLLQHALDLSYIESSLRLHEKKGLMSRDQVIAARIEPSFIHIEQAADKGSRWQYLYEDPRITTPITGSTSMLLSDYIPTLFGGNATETQDLKETLESLAHLAKQPTAKLERVLIEHLDSCAYRYDAWMQGLVNFQLQRMRKISAGKGHDKDVAATQGIYLGAYGWLEDVKPKDRQLEAVQLDGELKEKFQRKGDAALVKDSSNAGYILAPSLNHAVTAAVLRNGYISNRTSPAAKPFAINLSSERVRLALTVVDGMRAGQSLAALLGYQLERGLHDRHDTEVDEFILDLRKAFPLQSNQLQSTQTDEHDSIEQIEARNVIDGLALIEHIEKTGVRDYPFGADLPSAKPKQRTAINAEVQRIIELNDAVADLAMAEGVHQVVQGNYDRAAAVLDSYSKGHLPPTPDVIQTPRSGITITQRIGLQFKTTGIAPGTTTRSKAEPALNDWLKTVLPSMGEIVCAVEYFDPLVPKIAVSELGLEPIDLFYLLNISNEQAMSALDDMIYRHIIELSPRPRPDAEINILYTKPVTDKITLFELSPLIDSLRTLVLQSRPLNAADVKPSIAAKKTEEEMLFLDPERINLLMKELKGIVSQLPPTLPPLMPLQTFIDTIKLLIAAKDIDNLINNIDSFINELSGIFANVGMFGLPQTGTGYLYDWRRRVFSELMKKIEAVEVRLQDRLRQYDTLITNYDANWSDAEKHALLQKAERLITTTSTFPLPSPDNYFDRLVNIRRPAYEEQLDRIRDLLVKKTLTALFQGIAAEQTSLANFDLVGINTEDERKQVLIFADDIKINAENLNKDITQRLADAQILMDKHENTTSPKQRVELISSAAKKLLHEDFKLIPEFKLTEKQADEWANALSDAGNLLRYLHNDKAIDFPLDDWLYGMARVREKMHHLENATLFIEGMTSNSVPLKAIQLPYRENDYWLALPYPDTITENNEIKPFVINEDKLLYTAIYAENNFDKTKPQCGLLLDEWTEVIPMLNTTAGLSFHYDQPNTEPPQTLLLVTPPDFKSAWQWQDLVDTLHETLDMAKKRAVEPEHIDTTTYGRFLPAMVSAVTSHPITAALTLSLNNKFHLMQRQNNE